MKRRAFIGTMAGGLLSASPPPGAAGADGAAHRRVDVPARRRSSLAVELLELKVNMIVANLTPASRASACWSPS